MEINGVLWTHVAQERTFLLLFLQEVKVSSPDYRGIELDEAVFDFKQRIESMKCEYESIDEDRDNDLSYIKIYNQGEKYLVNRVQGKLFY